MIKFFLFAVAALSAEQTLSIIKPDAIDQVEKIDAYLENAGLRVVQKKTIHLTAEQAKEFLDKDRPFYDELVVYMTSGPVIVQILEGDDAVAVNRKVMGATDPAKASPGTIRNAFGKDIQHNAIHGSDTAENAKKEIDFFFNSAEVSCKTSS